MKILLDIPCVDCLSFYASFHWFLHPLCETVKVEFISLKDKISDPTKTSDLSYSGIRENINQYNLDITFLLTKLTLSTNAAIFSRNNSAKIKGYLEEELDYRKQALDQAYMVGTRDIQDTLSVWMVICSVVKHPV